MSISAALVKELRERTGSGMMECKKALVESNGDIEAAIETMRKNGMAKADKKADRTAAEGVIIARTSDDAKTAIIVEINCETDFVAKGDDFLAFTQQVGDAAMASVTADLDALMAQTVDGVTLNDIRLALVAKIGENISVRRYAAMQPAEGTVGSYLHGSRIGVLVQVTGGNAELIKDLAMHIAASKPVCVDETGVSADLIEKEKEIFTAQAAESGKPAEIIEKMIGGRIKKYLAEITLVGQPFVKNPDQTIAELLKQHGATIISFVRFEVGEGIEKKQDNFVEEVMAQARGA